MAKVPPHEPVKTKSVVWMSVADKHIIYRRRSKIDQAVNRPKAAVEKGVIDDFPFVLLPCVFDEQRSGDVSLRLRRRTLWAAMAPVLAEEAGRYTIHSEEHGLSWLVGHVVFSHLPA